MISRRQFTGGLALLAIAPIASCGKGDKGNAGSSASSVDRTKPVTINVQGLGPGAEKEAQTALAARVADFQKKHSNITVKTLEWQFDVQTFASQLAGGTLPTQFSVPFTEGRTLIENEQVAKLDPYLKDKPWYGKYQESLAAAASDADKAMWMLPYQPYGMSLTYNREIFREAGLDPEKPPTTWDEVRQFAKQIKDKTGKTGYAMMAKEGAGGWILTTVDYAMGGRILDGDPAKPTVHVDSDSMKKQLEMLKAMRWEDDSMGSQMLYDWGTSNADFAAGKIGMFIQGSDGYLPMIQLNKMDPKIYGLAPLPQEGEKPGVLGGGAFAAVNAKATPEEIVAAVDWAEFQYVTIWTDQEAAVADAKVAAANKQPVGVPGVPLFDRETYEKKQEWIKEYINVPLDQFKPYTDKMFEMNLVPEPPVKTQQIYAALAPMLQKVLTDKNADINALVAQYQKQVESIVAG